MGVVNFTFLIFVVMTTASASVVNTTVGLVRGIEYPVFGIEKFLGIPYAEATEGTLRFKPPVRKTRMAGVFNATTNDKVCPQDNIKTMALSIFSPNDPDPTEDCLRLDIYKPLTAKREKPLPVMIYIHGGGYLGGASRQADGTNLAVNSDVIVVCPNYRLGILAFFNTLDENAVGNFAFRDQCSAIEWVVDNIEAFGGNASQVTIFGQSAGSSSVLTLAMSSLCRGKFQRVIAESGTPYSHWNYNNNPLENALKIANRSGCPKESGPLVNCLRNKSISDIISYQPFSYFGTIDWAATYSGDVFPESPLEVVDKGDNSEILKYFRSLDILLGVTTSEGDLSFTARNSGNLFGTVTNLTSAILDEEAFLARLRRQLQLYTSREDEVVEKLLPAVKFQYTDWSNRDDEFARTRMYVRLSGDVDFHVSDVKTAVVHSGKTSIPNRGSTYFYQFNRRPSWMPKYPWSDGATHGDDLYYVFDLTRIFNGTQEDVDLAQEMMEYWGNFAKSGDPNFPNRKFIKTTWPTYNPDTEEYMKINVNSTVAKFPYAKRFAFWEHFFPSQLKLVNDCKKNTTKEEKEKNGKEGGFPPLFFLVLPHRDDLQKTPMQQAPSPSHIILTPGQPVAALTPITERQAKQLQLPLLESLV